MALYIQFLLSLLVSLYPISKAELRLRWIFGEDLKEGGFLVRTWRKVDDGGLLPGLLVVFWPI